MCGIGLLALLGDARESEETARWNQLLSRALANRGPDLPMRSCASGGADGSTVTMHASVLHMRGREPSPQPARFLVSEELECTLCWNGEAYAYCDSPGSDSKGSDSNADVGVSVDQDMIELVDHHEEESDTRVVIDLLKGSLSGSMSAEKEHEAVSLALSCIHGEFAFILCVPRSNSTSIYFGRDCLGRRSLLVSRFDGVLALSSVSVDLSGTSAWTEIRPGTVFRIDMKSGEETEKPIPKMTNGCIPAMIPRQFSDDRIDEAARGLLLCLDKAVERRVAHPPSPKSQSTNDASVAVLFSGGIDSVVLAALSHRHVPVDQPIDLINVSFFNDPPDASSSKSPDRLAAILSYEEMTTRFPQRKWRFIAVDVVYSQVLENERHILDLIAPLDSTMDFNIGVAFWFASRGEGRLLGSSEVDAARREIEGKSRGGGSTNSSDQPLLRFANSNDSRGECAVEKVEKGDKRAPSSSHSIPDDITGILSSAKILLSGVGADGKCCTLPLSTKTITSTCANRADGGIRSAQDDVPTRRVRAATRRIEDGGWKAVDAQPRPRRPVPVPPREGDTVPVFRRGRSGLPRAPADRMQVRLLPPAGLRRQEDTSTRSEDDRRHGERGDKCALFVSFGDSDCC